ncbi:MAG: acetyl-CoA carboxylase carboxyl transferase subunit beta [Nitrospinae bacterium CG11_big_fil_rev_8_21_14_0_20_56_8]|nr:MAG: acetyl-CoA carboxylase carboxyl transferase subunit beta [Nitrospinae bacterium CG11_big_fil_rev_8_21_14_0_20_56_8]
MSWLDKLKDKSGIRKKLHKPEEIWFQCKNCAEVVYYAEFEDNLNICPRCDHHYRINARERISLLTEPDSFVEHNSNMISTDPLKFKDTKRYKDRIRQVTKKDIPHEAIVTGTARLGQHTIELCVFEFEFMGGSMGSVVGEKITRSIELAMRNNNPLIIVNCSGGARMQEGILSLMQMAKTSAALRKLAEKRIPYISILTDPTTGGVSASFAMLGDIILAEPGALVGFAGPRVIEQTIKQKLPEGFQRAEFLVEHGLIDNIVHRKKLKSTLDKLICLFKNLPTARPAVPESVLTPKKIQLRAEDLAPPRF